MAQFGVRLIGLEALKALLARTPGAVHEVERRVVLKLAKLTEAGLKKRLNNQDVRSRSGALKRSAGSDNVAQQEGSGFFARAGYGAEGGPSARYARVQEGVDRSGNEVESTTITPKGKLLAMPIGISLTGAGVPRFATDNGKWLRAFAPEGFWISRPGNAPIFVQKAGGPRSERLDLVAIGLRRLTVKGKHSLRKSAEEARAQASGIIEAELRRALRSA